MTMEEMTTEMADHICYQAELICDNCGESMIGHENHANLFTGKAYRLGWRIAADSTLLCPECATKGAVKG